ncbi:MAG: acetyl-CoA carboxylase biotin carboxyl carrier protein subunit [Gemmatimonadota bacterium]
MKFYVHAGDDSYEIRANLGSGTPEVEVDGQRQPAALRAAEAWAPASGGRRVARLGHQWLPFAARRKDDGSWELEVEGERHLVTVLDAGEEAVREARKASGVDSGPAPLRAPMPGLVVRVEVEVGQEVKPGDGVLIVEAMKMENELRASSVGRVLAIHVSPGDAVEKDLLLVEFEPLAEPGE